MTKLSAQLPVSVFKEGKHFIAYTPSLDLSTSGKSYKQVMLRFNEVVGIFFEELSKKGTTEEVLLGLGWDKIKKHLTPPNLISQESRRVEFTVR